MKVPAVNAGGLAAFETSKEGMKGAERRLNRAAARIARGDLGVEPMVDMLVSQRTYAANAKVVKAQDEMVGALLNTLR